MDSSKKSNKISDVVKLKQMLKKWRKQANSSTQCATASTSSSNSCNNKKSSLNRSNSVKGITFLKRTLSFTDISATGMSSNSVPKGFLAVEVGEGKKRFVIPTNYLSHQAFSILLKEAEEEFGFQQEGVLKIPCQVDLFETILKVVEATYSPQRKTIKPRRNDRIICGSSEAHSLYKSPLPLSPMCR